MTNFGDGLPPGCTDADVDVAFGARCECCWLAEAEMTCEGCGKSICPDCNFGDHKTPLCCCCKEEANDGNDDAE